MPVVERAGHYLQKVIFEQPQALGNTLEMLGGAGRLQPGIFGADAEAIFAEVCHLAVELVKGTDVANSHNLAKNVTVE